MYAVLQWDPNIPFGKPPLLIAESRTYEEAQVIAGMNQNLYHRQIVTMEELGDIHYV